METDILLGATLFYDTIFKAFQKLIERIANKEE